jgi:methionyl-tRNA formyltransferase
MLPSYRGFSPTVWSIINGEKQTGVTLFEIAEGVDEGDIIDQVPVRIGPDDTIAGVLDTVTAAYLDILQRNIQKLVNNAAPRRQQDHSQATYCCKRLPQDNLINWSLPSSQIFNLIRALTTPYPGAFTTLNGKRLIIWEARRVNRVRSYAGLVPGRIVEARPGEGAVVLTGNGELVLTVVQLEGEDKVPAGTLLRSLNITLGPAASEPLVPQAPRALERVPTSALCVVSSR